MLTLKGKINQIKFDAAQAEEQRIAEIKRRISEKEIAAKEAFQDLKELLEEGPWDRTGTSVRVLNDSYTDCVFYTQLTGKPTFSDKKLEGLLKILRDYQKRNGSKTIVLCPASFRLDETKETTANGLDVEENVFGLYQTFEEGLITKISYFKSDDKEAVTLEIKTYND